MFYSEVPQIFTQRHSRDDRHKAGGYAYNYIHDCPVPEPGIDQIYGIHGKRWKGGESTQYTNYQERPG